MTRTTHFLSDLILSLLQIGLNFSLIPSTGWGNLAYALFLGSLNEKCSALNPILLQDPHPSAYHRLAPGSVQIKEILQSQRIVREGLLEGRRATVPVLHAVDHMYFDVTRVS